MVEEPTIYGPTIAITIFLCGLLFMIPRKYFLMPFIVAACFVPADQRVLIMQLDFTPLRILVLVGFSKMFLESGFKIEFNRFDKLLIVWALVGAMVYIVQWKQMGAVINRSGFLFDVLGLYFIFRASIQSWNDICLNLKIFGVCAFFMTVLVGIEWSTGQNPFEKLGSVATIVREGNFRCQASFPHSIMMGLFWGNLVPLFVGLAIIEKQKLFYALSAFACLFIVTSSASSTPILVTAGVLCALVVYKLRNLTRLAFLCFVFILAALHVVMRAPVWHLLARINVIGGSTGWHRYKLINLAVENFREWALLGTKTTEHWGTGLYDITNQYILVGVRGGFITLILFVALLLMGFSNILYVSLNSTSKDIRIFSWCIFVAMLGHCVGFLGVSYFGQTTLLWYLMLAVTGFITQHKNYLQEGLERESKNNRVRRVENTLQGALNG